MSSKRDELLKQFPPEFKDLWFIHNMTTTELNHLLKAILDYGFRRLEFGKDLQTKVMEQFEEVK